MRASIFTLFTLLAFFCTGCSHSKGDRLPVVLDGYIATDGGVTGAKVQLQDVQGHVIAEKSAATGDTGAFSLTTPWLPDAFQVASVGGTVHGSPLTYTLRGHFAGFDPANGVLWVNLPTTLVCAYLDQNPGKSVDEANRVVKAYLEIPAGVDLARDLHGSTKLFSPEIFLGEAEAAGGVGSFMNQLVKEMAQDSQARHGFPAVALGDPPAAPLAQCAGTSMATAARNGLIAWGVGQALGKVMSELFPGSGAPTAGQIAELKAMLTQIQQQLVDVRNDIQSLKIDTLDAQYSTNTMFIATYVNNIQETYDKLNMQLQKDPATLTATEVAQRKAILKSLMERVNTKIKDDLGTFHTMLYGSQGADGLFQTYAKKLKAEKRFLSKKNYQDKVKALMLYYNQLETTGAYLAAEYSRYEEFPSDLVLYDMNVLGTRSQEELTWFNSVKMIPAGFYLDQGQGLVLDDRFQAFENVKEATLRRVAMNEQSCLGYKDWRKITEGEVNSLLVNRTVSPYQCLQDRGMEITRTTGVWLACVEEIGFRFPQTFTADFRAFRMDTGDWYNISDDYVSPKDAANWIIVCPIGGDRYTW